MRIVVAEDHALFRAGVVGLLHEAGHQVVAQAVDLQSLLDSAALKPDLVIADIRMPPTHRDEGIQAAVTLRAAQPDLGVLLLSQYVEARSAVRLLRQHPRGLGYLLKDHVTGTADFLDAAQRVAAGGFVIDPDVGAALLDNTWHALDHLSPRELDVLRGLAAGRSNRAIAKELYLTERTVESHVRSVFTKLGLQEDPADHRRVLAVLAYLRQLDTPALR